MVPPLANALSTGWPGVDWEARVATVEAARVVRATAAARRVSSYESHTTGSRGGSGIGVSGIGDRGSVRGCEQRRKLSCEAGS